MKVKIHPQWYDNCKVTCSCGNTFVTGSTKPEINVGICSLCHPFFTGEMKYVDTLGRVERFKQILVRAKTKKYVKKADRKKSQIKEEEAKDKKQPKTLKEMLQKELKKSS